MSKQDIFNPITSFEKIFVFYNPVSTNAKRSRKRISDLKLLFPAKEINVAETSPDGDTANKKIIHQLAKDFDQDTLLCVASGDGTISIVLEALMDSSKVSDKARQVIILPLWGGNANDLAHMLNGRSIFSTTKRLFEKGQVHSIYPIEFNLQSKQSAKRKIAACYGSFGASAFAANYMEEPGRRSRRIYNLPGVRLFSEVVLVNIAFAKTKKLQLEADGKNSKIIEYIFMNGPRLAKLNRIPHKLSKKGFYMATFHDKHPKVLLNIIKAVRNLGYGKISEGPIEFTIKSSCFAQFDGELEKIEPNTKVVARLYDKSFRVLATKL